MQSCSSVVEMKGSTDVRGKEGMSLVKEFIVRMVLECEPHETREMVNEFLRRMHPNETTRGRIRMEALLTSGGKRNGNIAVAWT